MESYPDELTLRLVAASSEILAISGDESFRAFGRHSVLDTEREGYGPLIESAGRTLPEFLSRDHRRQDRTTA